MDPVELSKLLEQAAEKGAKRALERIGLHDEDAGKDIYDLRNLIDGWRGAKKAVSSAFLQWLTVAILGLMTGIAYFKIGVGK
jgi:hypothetical protein